MQVGDDTVFRDAVHIADTPTLPITTAMKHYQVRNATLSTGLTGSILKHNKFTDDWTIFIYYDICKIDICPSYGFHDLCFNVLFSYSFFSSIFLFFFLCMYLHLDHKL